MTAEKARQIVPIYAAYEEEETFDLPKRQERSVNHWTHWRERFIKRNGLAIIGMFIWAASLMIGCIVTGVIEHHNAYQEAEAWYAEQLEAYKVEQAKKEQAEHWLSGTASRDAAINQAVNAVAPVIAKLNTDAQKLTETCCMLARVMNKYYPNSFEEVAEQPQQWMFYDGTDKTCSQRDRDLAEQIIRPYMENGIVPNGLTDQMVYGEWSQNDFVLRDSYKTTSTMHTFRFQA